MFAQPARYLLICLDFATTAREKYFEEYFGQCLSEKLQKLTKGTKRPRITFESVMRTYPKLKEYLFS